MCVSKYGCATVALQFVLIPLHYESLKEFELPKDVVCKNIDAKYNAFTHGHKMRLKSKFDEKMENNGQHSQNRKKTNISWRKERKNKINVCITKISTKFHYFVLLLIAAASLAPSKRKCLISMIWLQFRRKKSSLCTESKKKREREKNYDLSSVIFFMR